LRYRGPRMDSCFLCPPLSAGQKKNVRSEKRLQLIAK
jgi:hypothetical protein